MKTHHMDLPILNKKAKTLLLLFFSFFILILFILLEALFSFEKEMDVSLYRALTKGGIGLFSLLLSFFFFEKGKYFYVKIFTLSLFMIADIFINFYFAIGGGFFALAHLCLLIYFLRKHKFDKSFFILALISFVIFATTNLIFIEHNKALNTIGLILYSFIISCLLGSVRKENLFLKLSVFVFALSDLLLMINVGIGVTLVLGHIARFVYYVSLVMISVSKENKIIRKEA